MGLIWRDRVGSNGMKWDGGRKRGLSLGLLRVLTSREGNFWNGQRVLFSHSPSQCVPFDPTPSRQIKPCATWVVPSRPIDKFRIDTMTKAARQ
jgi:hypothetical protein